MSKSKALLSRGPAHADDLSQLLFETSSLNEELRKWPDSQPREWTPSVTQCGGFARNESIHSIDWWPATAHKYLDRKGSSMILCLCFLTSIVYVAAVWNTYRKVCLMVLDIMIRCSDQLHRNDECIWEQAEVKRIADDVVASIPYHLTDNMQGAAQQSDSIPERIVPGKTIGGLLLMHSLYVMSNLSVIPTSQQSHMKECLAWIGLHMGVGQATLLSKVRERQWMST